MNNPLEEFTQQAVKVFGNSASKDFYAKLGADGYPSATRCTGCSKVSYPPREHCPACFGGEVEWVKLPEHGTLYAFTTNKRGLRFTAPTVIGVVEFEDVGLVIGPVEGDRHEDTLRRVVATREHERGPFRAADDHLVSALDHELGRLPDPRVREG